jgi:DNA-directed RNA polymerase subunit RPC12/RpoP
LKSLNYKKKNVELKNAIKQLEKTQENKPLILHCKYCKSWYYSNKDFDIICPNCGRDQLYAAYNCINCEKWYFKDTPNEDYICNSCNVKLLKQDKEMLQDLIHEKGKILREYKKKKEDFSILDSNLD